MTATANKFCGVWAIWGMTSSSMNARTLRTPDLVRSRLLEELLLNMLLSSSIDMRLASSEIVFVGLPLSRLPERAFSMMASNGEGTKGAEELERSREPSLLIVSRICAKTGYPH